MKRISIKLKLTLWFTAIMILLAFVMAAVTLIATNSVAQRNSRAVLNRVMSELTEEIEYDSGELELDDDFRIYKDNVYSLLAKEDGSVITGYLPADELMQIPFEDGALKEISGDGELYYLLDRKLSFSNGPGLWLRSAVPVSGRTVNAEALKTGMLIMLPVSIILAAVGGYLLARRSLKPIREIRDTAESVAASGDLTRRIEVKSYDELGQLSETFNKMFDRLEVNFDAERQFTSDASHELRTPVSVILAQCEYAFENASGELELYECIGSIQRQGYRMSKLIESLLAFARLEQQTERIQLIPVDISVLTEEVCREQSEAPENHIALEMKIQPGITANADGALFSRMISNLIRNAYRYGRENGYIRVSLTEKQGDIELSVEDNGIGIAPEDIPNIWNRFYRADKSRSSAKEGLGLGLSMVSRIVQIHGGRITVESREQEGSKFTVFLKKTDF